MSNFISNIIGCINLNYVRNKYVTYLLIVSKNVELFNVQCEYGQ